MRIIKLMPDYFCYPLWEASPGVIGNIDPSTLPISPGLQRKLIAWAEIFDRTIDMNDPASAGFKSARAVSEFNQEGAHLAERLRAELGCGFAIIERHERTYP